MGRESSPLRERVIFVDGAPRSGTTWLVTLLATHPEIAGVEAESHLFDYGVDRLFDNVEYRHPTTHGLERYVDREHLVDLVRDLCDGALMSMRERLAPGEDPRYVVEKTPIAPHGGGRDVQRKADCYPDAWYIHIVRDREAVARSLMRAPWMEDRSYEHCSRVWDDCVRHARDALGDLPHYREIRYEDLRDDPGAVCGSLFEWLGVDAGEHVIETARKLSRDPYSDLGAVGADQPRSGREALRALAARLRARARDALLRSSEEPAPSVPEGGVLTFRFVQAFRERDAATLRSLTAPKLELVLRSADGDVSVRGDEARDVLEQLSADAFSRGYVGEWWTAAGGSAPFWTAVNEKTTWTGLFSGLRGDATRVDCAIGLIIEDDLVRRVVVIAAGPLTGRPVVEPHEPPVSSA